MSPTSGEMRAAKPIRLIRNVFMMTAIGGIIGWVSGGERWLLAVGLFAMWFYLMMFMMFVFDSHAEKGA